MNRTLHTWRARAALLALTAVLPVSAAAAGRGPVPPLSSAAGAEDDVERLDKWPDLGGQIDQVRDDIARVRKARTPEMAGEGEANLVQVGAGIVPELLPVLGKERDAAALERVERILTKVTGAPHTRLLSAYFDDKATRVRTWALTRCAAFPDAGLRGAAEQAFSRVEKQGEKADTEERYAAALCATSSGSLAGFDVLAQWAVKRFGERGAQMRAALEAVRGKEAAAKALALLQGERADKVAGLNLLAGCGDKDVIPQVKPYLDNDDNSLRIAAINALRGIVDGEGPLERLPVFEAIELAKTWKARV